MRLSKTRHKNGRWDRAVYEKTGGTTLTNHNGKDGRLMPMNINGRKGEM